MTDARPRPPVGRSVVATRDGIVATSHPLAAMAGVQALERGGTAVDAAIAANDTLGVVEPMMNGVGGDLFAMVSVDGSSPPTGLNASGWSPAMLTPDFVESLGYDTMPASGIHSVTVPGAVAGWEALRARFGHLPLGEILAPAIHYAEEGFPVAEVGAQMWADYAATVAGDPGARATYLPGGHAPPCGSIVRNPDLAVVLSEIGNDGAEAFYRGPLATRIVDYAKTLGGTLRLADLSEFEPEWVAPLERTYRGWHVYELPPNTQGIAALLMLAIMEQFPIGEYGWHSARALHVMIEAKKLASADLMQYVGDPRTMITPIETLLSERYGPTRAALIDATRALPAAAPSAAAPSAAASTLGARGSDTVYVAAVDRSGMIVSLIQSIFAPFGSGLVAPGTGFALQNRGALFTLQRDHPNTLAPRKRPLHTLIPALMEKAGSRIGFGIMGGWNQAQAHAQFISHVADFDCSIQEALEAGRFGKRTLDGCDVKVESLVPDAVRRALEGLGHDVETVAPRSANFGFGQAVMCSADGVHFGASDPRHDGAAIPEGPAHRGLGRRAKHED
jgi:gamma-glutamyltranspeptidase/glutathione hydrolase